MRWKDELSSSLLAAFFLGNLLKNASCYVSRLTLLEKSNELEQVHGHHLVCIYKLELMCLGLHKEDFFTLLLCCVYLHCSTDVATIKIADELYLTPHELMHWHEGGLLGSTKPADQLVTNIGEPGNYLKVIPYAFIKVHLCMVCVSGASLGNDICQFGQTYVLKTLTHQVNSVRPLSFRVSKSQVNIIDLKLRSVNARKEYSAPNCAWSGLTCPVISLAPFSKEILTQSGCFKPSLIRLYGIPLAPKDVQQVYQ